MSQQFKNYPTRVIRQIQSVLTPDLSIYKRFSTPFSGTCYPATEALYYLWGKERGFKPHVLKFQENTHWYLENDKGHIADPTREQYCGTTIPYHKGIGCGFLSEEPSKRCQIILARLLWSTAVKKRLMSISVDQENGETRFHIYRTRAHSSELLLELTLYPNTANGFSRSLPL